jgi:hypothetical protein
MEFWTKPTIREIGDSLGKMVVVDDSFFISHDQSLAHVLVKLEMRKVLFASLDLFQQGKIHSLTLDYLNIPFLYAQCHEIGHVFRDSSKNMARKIWRIKD